MLKLRLVHHTSKVYKNYLQCVMLSNHSGKLTTNYVQIVVNASDEFVGYEKLVRCICEA